MRAIDADAFIEFLRDAIKQLKYDNLKIDELLTVADVIEAIISELEGTSIAGFKNAPTIEPERKKGTWILDNSRLRGNRYICDKCGYETDTSWNPPPNFCPNCWAEMHTPVETARDIVHTAIDNSVWSDAVDTAKMHKIVDDKYAEIRGDANVDANT